MRSYEQYCALALALDQIGERWTLLIVRELLTGPKRYADLQHGLPGVPSNLLAARLKSMEENGLVERRTLPRPAATSVYALSRSGEELADPVRALVRWGGRFMQKRSRQQAFRPHWLAIALEALLRDAVLPKRPLLARLELPEGMVVLQFGPACVRVVSDVTVPPGVRVRGSAPLVLGVAAGEIPWGTALATGMEVDGAPHSIRAFRAMFSRDSRSAVTSRRARKGRNPHVTFR